MTELRNDRSRRDMTRLVMAIAISVVLVTGCNDGPDCKRSHTELIPITTLVGKTPVVNLVPVEVCDE